MISHTRHGGSVLVNYSGTLSVPRLLHVIALHLPVPATNGTGSLRTYRYLYLYYL
jgi:hypothetical protein